MGLKIYKIGEKNFKHNDTVKGDFRVSKFYTKEEFGKFTIVEFYGSEHLKYTIDQIEVFAIGGTAETFSNFDDLYTRLIELRYPAFYQDGEFIFNPASYDLSEFNNAEVDRFAKLSDIPEVPVYQAGTNIDIDYTNPLEPVINSLGVGTSKKTQIIEFAWTGGGYGANANWWRLTPFIGKYGTTFQNSGLVPTDAFAGDTNFCFRETLMFDGKIKAITVEGDNNGITWNCDFALANFNLSFPYNAGASGSGVTNRQIVARKQFSVGTGSAQTRTFWTIVTDFYDVLLPKDSVIKPYFKSQGVANSNWQNVVMKILIEEV